MRFEIKFERRDRVLACIIGIAYLLTLIPASIWTIWPKTLTTDADLFLFPSCHEKISLAWWFKNLFDLNLPIVCYTVLAMVLKKYSRFWFFICALIVEYHIMDFVSFVCNYSSNIWTYLINIIADAIIIIWFIYGKKESNLKAV